MRTIAIIAAIILVICAGLREGAWIAAEKECRARGGMPERGDGEVLCYHREKK